MTQKEKEYWRISKKLDRGIISSSDFEYMLSARDISVEDLKRYESYKTINWAFGMLLFVATVYYFLLMK